MSNSPNIKNTSARATLHHESAHKHVTGEAVYIDDMPQIEGTLHGALGWANETCGKIQSIDLAEVWKSDGVIDVLTAKELVGHNDISPTGLGDEPILADEKIEFHGQPIFLVIAETRAKARQAATKAKIAINQDENFVIDVADALAKNNPEVTPGMTLSRGKADEALEQSKNRLSSSMRIGGQDHFYLETHIALAIPGEDQDMVVWSSTQHPSEVQHMVSHALGAPSSSVTVKIRRMGGGFGGKETQSNQFAVLAAIAAKRNGRPVKIRPDRDEDMMMTGKRHDFLVKYNVGFDDNGVIDAVKAEFAARCGFSSDLSGPVTDRALFHADNCYYFPSCELISKPLKTNTVSNTAFRGFGGPQGMIAGERIIEDIAYSLGLDPLEIRKRNLYGENTGTTTPYHQEVEDNIASKLIAQLEEKSDYQARRMRVLAFNSENEILRKGIALTPVKFGISFTATWYNQAGALVHVYRDGSIHLNHGGTEMGQGLNTKVAKLVADEFGIDANKVSITATTTDKVPNTSATAASSGTDLNGMAVVNACQQIKERLVLFADEKYGCKENEIRFESGKVILGERSESFASFIDKAYMARVQLSAAGFYKTPKIHWDRAKGSGRPFYYFAYGASVSEVTLDTLTGEYQIDRVDILHDAGKSLNPAIDRGQIEGGFIQGMGWLTTEELWWDKQGRLKTHAPSTYKIPLASDIPKIFNTEIADWSENREMTIRRSKAVGEPPFMLAISVLEALSMAVASVGNYEIAPRLNAPATPETILMAIGQIRKFKNEDAQASS